MRTELRLVTWLTVYQDEGVSSPGPHAANIDFMVIPALDRWRSCRSGLRPGMVRFLTRRARAISRIHGGDGGYAPAPVGFASSGHHDAGKSSLVSAALSVFLSAISRADGL